MEQPSRRLTRPPFNHPFSQRKRLYNAPMLRLFLVATTTCLMILPYFLAMFVETGEDTHARTKSSLPSADIHGDSSQKQQSAALGPSVSSQYTLSARPIRTNPSSWSCAICFFGLPRSFQLLVLPSIVQNVLIPNNANRCDFYLHYYDIKTEGKSRSGVGGTLDTEQVWLLQDAVDRIYNNVNDTAAQPKVHLSIVKDTNESFWEQHHERVHRYMNEKGEDGKLLYYPWMAKSYDNNSIINLIKQWHSIQEVWKAMERGGRQRFGSSMTKMYDRVAMLRNDVVFVTPFDIYQLNATWRDKANQFVSVPNWARFPINDRMVYGPAPAVKIWATERFERLEGHVQTYAEPGYGLHSERFLDHAIFPAIRQELGYEVTANPEICFFRARADGSCWINDCATRNGAALGFRTIDTQKLVEDLVGRKCIRSKYTNRIVQLQCTPQS
jgi:hypothetical protein